MVKTPFIFVLFLLIQITSAGQSNTPIESQLSKWSEKDPIQKLYLQTDRDTYLAGDTVWFKGYFMSLFEPSYDNTTVFVELTGIDEGVIVTNVFPVYLSVAAGQLEIPDTLKTGNYLLRAYSPLMMNQPLFTFRKILQIVGKDERTLSQKPSVLTVTFFPESGNFIAGLENTIAFKAHDSEGQPADFHGIIRNSKGDNITNIQSVHDGMGTFKLTPEAEEIYFVEVNGTRYVLPIVEKEGTKLEVVNSNGGKRFRIVSTATRDELKPALILGQMQGKTVFRKKLENDGSEFKGSVNTGSLYSGILHLTVFNENNLPLAERITFVDNKEYIVEGNLTDEHFTFEKKGKNQFSIILPDSIEGSFSISVTDTHYNEQQDYAGNIWSWFLLGSDLRGNIYRPYYYFDPDNPKAAEHLELVMMTNGWTRFKWKDLSEENYLPLKYKDPGYITLSGSITSAGKKRAFADKDIILFMAKDSTRFGKNPILLTTDAEGRFTIDSLIFFEKAYFLFSDVKGNKSQSIKARFSKDDIFGGPYPVLTQSWPQNIKASEAPGWDPLRDTGLTGKNVLREVIVKGKYRSTLEKLDDDYASGMFKGNFFNRILDIRNENSSGDIFQYLRERIPGLRVAGGPGSYRLNYRGGNLRYYLDGEPPDDPTGDVEDNSNVTVFLDEMPSNITMIESIPLGRIAMVKLIPFSPMVAGGGTALAIYLKKGKDLEWNNIDNGASTAEYYGYTIIKEFYEPDYSIGRSANVRDNRTTLQWIADYQVKASNPRIPVSFYNSDRTQKFRIVAEGVTTEGRLLHFEKIISK